MSQQLIYKRKNKNSYEQYENILNDESNNVSNEKQKSVEKIENENKIENNDEEFEEREQFYDNESVSTKMKSTTAGAFNENNTKTRKDSINKQIPPQLDIVDDSHEVNHSNNYQENETDNSKFNVNQFS